MRQTEMRHSLITAAGIALALVGLAVVGMGVVKVVRTSQVDGAVALAPSALETQIAQAQAVQAVQPVLPAQSAQGSAIALPPGNPPTPAGIELGRHLFYDVRLSGNGTQSCSSCHIQALAFSDGKALPTGSTGEAILRNSPALVNVGYNATLTWANPALTTGVGRNRP